MKRISWERIWICFALWGIFIFPVNLPLCALEKPNIILILADDLGFGDVGFNGQKKIQTPCLDQMAEEGITFPQFYAGAPVCGPSRATLLYGQHTGHAPIRGNPRWTKSGQKPELSSDNVLLSHEMKRAGYTNAVFGKWGMNENLETNVGHPLNQGFDEFCGFNTHVEAHFHWPEFVWDGFEKIIVEPKGRLINYKERSIYADDFFQHRALDFLDRKAGKEPFFMFLCYTIPHLGYTVPTDSSDLYKNKGWPATSSKSHYYEGDEDVFRAYAGMITRMDRFVGEIRNKLEALGIGQNTLVLFTSDNGDELWSDFFDSNGPLRGGKRDLTEGGIRVPTVAVWPEKIEESKEVNTPFAFWDILPTFCEVGGIRPVVETDGISFLPTLLGKTNSQKKHSSLYWEFNEKKGPMQAIRFGNWKAIRTWNKELQNMGKMQLFNLENDLGEQVDVSSKYSEICQRALKIFEESRTEHPEWPLKPIKPNP